MPLEVRRAGTAMALGIGGQKVSASPKVTTAPQGAQRPRTFGSHQVSGDGARASYEKDAMNPLYQLSRFEAAPSLKQRLDAVPSLKEEAPMRIAVQTPVLEGHRHAERTGMGLSLPTKGATRRMRRLSIDGLTRSMPAMRAIDAALLRSQSPERGKSPRESHANPPTNVTDNKRRSSMLIQGNFPSQLSSDLKEWTPRNELPGTMRESADGRMIIKVNSHSSVELYPAV